VWTGDDICQNATAVYLVIRKIELLQLLQYKKLLQNYGSCASFPTAACFSRLFSLVEWIGGGDGSSGGCSLSLLLCMICHSKTAIDPGPQRCHQDNEVEQHTVCNRGPVAGAARAGLFDWFSLAQNKARAETSPAKPDGQRANLPLKLRQESLIRAIGESQGLGFKILPNS
jgi:hypothetical protein